MSEIVDEHPPIDEAAAEPLLPWERGLPTLFVFAEGDEVQTAHMNMPSPNVMRLIAMLDVAKAKLELLKVNMMEREMAQRQHQQEGARLYLPS